MRIFAAVMLLVGIGFLLVCCGHKENTRQKLVVGIEAGYAPYALRDASGRIVGLDLDVAQAIADRLGKELIISEMAWDALIVALKQGKIDLWMSGVSITPEREKHMVMVPYLHQADELTLLFWRRCPQEVKGIGDLVGMGLVAVQMGTPLEIWLRQQEGVEIKSVEAISDMIMALKYGKIVAGLIDSLPAQVLQAQVPELIALSVPIAPEQASHAVGIGIASENEELVRSIQTAVIQLTEEGTLTAIEAKWRGKQA